MGDDIVTRLRGDLPYHSAGVIAAIGKDREEAADEIERLRAERDELRKLVTRLSVYVKHIYVHDYPNTSFGREAAADWFEFRVLYNGGAW